MRRGIMALAMLQLAAATTAWVAAPPVAAPRTFTKEQHAWLDRTDRQINEHRLAGRFEDAEKLSLARVALHERILGADHWKTANERLNLARVRRLTTIPER